jgi:hypothetical protein
MFTQPIAQVPAEHQPWLAGASRQEGMEQGERLCWRLPEDAVPDIGEDMKIRSRVLRR